MSSASVTSIRQEYKNETRSRILDATIDLLSDQSEAALTIAAVAAKAGVTDRTVYRHFDTREELLRAVWPRMQQKVGSQGFPQTAAALVGSPRKLFPRFDEAAQLIRASVYSPAGLELRLQSNEDRQASTIACIQDALPDLDQGALRRRAAVAQLINSAYAWEVMRQFWGLSGEEAGAAAAEALEILLGQAPAGASAEHLKEKEKGEVQ
jgi:AcrR family transcriptional regulator